jgi:hypothetical protein
MNIGKRVSFIPNNKDFYFLSVRMKQSDWLRSLSERAGFLHPARFETQLPAVKCNCPLWFSRQKMRSETIFKRNKLPKTLEKRRLTIGRYENKFHQALKTYILSTMYTRINNILRKMRLKQ